MKLELKQLLCRLGVHRYMYTGRIDSGEAYLRCEWCGQVVCEMFLR
jgi:hypothetical protein